MATPIPKNEAAFSLDDLVRITDGRLAGAAAPAAFIGVSTDTRTLSSGGVFVALQGERFDGHDFVGQATAAGAALAIVGRELDVEVAQLVVGDTLTALGKLASHHRRRWAGPVLAIAGAAGKTTTRATASAILEAVHGSFVHSSLGNLNNRIGVPMVLLGLTDAHRMAVVEVGTNQTGEVPLLAAMVQPDVAILTLVDLEHSEGLGSIDAIEEEEGAIFAESCHTLVVNADDFRAMRQANAAKARRAAAGKPVHVVTYGFGDESSPRLVSRLSLGTAGADVSIAVGQRDLRLRIPIVGKPACYAVLAAIAGSEALTGKELLAAEVQAGLDSPSFKPEGRAELVAGPGEVLIVNDSYNANPASMRSALLTAQELATDRGTRLHLVLGEMRELGDLSRPAHAELGHFLLQRSWVSLFAVGEQMLPLVEVVQQDGPSEAIVEHSEDTQGIARKLLTRLRPGDVLLVKGSRGVRTEAVIGELLSENNL